MFQGRYQHRNAGQRIDTPSELWLAQAADGSITALAKMNRSTEVVRGNATHRIIRSQAGSPAAGNRPGVVIDLAFEPGKAFLSRTGLRQDLDRHELAVPPDAWFDPNTRPDAYCAAHILVRAFAIRPGETNEFRAFDLDETGDALASYTMRVQHVGRERIEVPAGSFDANHLVFTQLTSAATWFKKRAGHSTDFWVLDNHVIARIRRNREPYELALLDYSIPGKLPGHISGPPAREVAAGDAAPANYGSDWSAFVAEVDQSYPFFELKGIRDDWAKAKVRLGERVRRCVSDSDFLEIVNDAIRCLRDAHMGVSKTRVSQRDRPKRYYPGVSFMPATENRIIVMAAEAHSDQLKPGTIVTQIDGRDARTVLDEIAAAAWSGDSSYPVPVSSPQRARLFVYRWPLLASSNCTHTLRYVAEGQSRDLPVTCDIEPRGWPHTYHLPSNLTSVGRGFGYTQLPSGAGYMYLRQVNDETATAMQQALAAHPHAKGWIIDLRGNGGGGYDNTLLTQLQALPRPVATLIDAGCISAGETLARDLAQVAHARLLGARSAGASSAKREWTFPSGIASVTFSTRSRWRNDGQPIEFNGISPDDEIEAVPEEVARGLNSEIMRAEEYLARSTATSR